MRYRKTSSSTEFETQVHGDKEMPKHDTEASRQAALMSCSDVTGFDLAFAHIAPVSGWS